MAESPAAYLNQAFFRVKRPRPWVHQCLRDEGLPSTRRGSIKLPQRNRADVMWPDSQVENPLFASNVATHQNSTGRALTGVLHQLFMVTKASIASRIRWIARAAGRRCDANDAPLTYEQLRFGGLLMCPVGLPVAFGCFSRARPDSVLIIVDR